VEAHHGRSGDDEMQGNLFSLHAKIKYPPPSSWHCSHSFWNIGQVNLPDNMSLSGCARSALDERKMA
jgi:hypothetical protein